MKFKKTNVFRTLGIAFICVVTVAGICIGAMTKKTSAAETPIHNPATLKERASITIKDVPKNYSRKVIGREKAIEIAKEFTGDMYKSAKSIHAQYNLISDNSISINAISKDAVDANVELKNKQKIEEIAVWIVSFEGLEFNRRNGHKLTEENIVVDAVTGKVLYGFKYR